METCDVCWRLEGGLSEFEKLEGVEGRLCLLEVMEVTRCTPLRWTL